MNTTDIPIDDLLKRLHLANARRIWRDLVSRAEKDSWGFGDFLATLVAEEVAHRQQTRLGRLTRRAHFPFLKTVDEFDFTLQSTLRLSLLGSFLSPDFVTDGRGLILSGKTGRGKTHLAIAIAYRAIQNGFDALFTTAAALIDDLARASRDGRMREALALYTHPHVLVIDEVGYLTYGTEAANVLFHVVNDRHLKRRPMIFTTNKSLRSWGRVLHDEDLAQAIIDRILERGRLLELDGPSGRTRHLPLDLDGGHAAQDEPARVSGTAPAKFPEPAEQKRSLLEDASPSRSASCRTASIVRIRWYNSSLRLTAFWSPIGPRSKVGRCDVPFHSSLAMTAPSTSPTNERGRSSSSPSNVTRPQTYQMDLSGDVSCDRLNEDRRTAQQYTTWYQPWYPILGLWPICQIWHGPSYSEPSNESLTFASSSHRLALEA